MEQEVQGQQFQTVIIPLRIHTGQFYKMYIRGKKCVQQFQEDYTVSMTI